MNWFNKIFGRGVTEQPLRPIPRCEPYPVGYTLGKWQASPHLAEQAQQLFHEELFRHIMAVLVNSIPSGYPARGAVVNDTTANIELGRIQGYLDCLNLLNSLATPVRTHEELPTTWNAETDIDQTYAH